MEKPVVKEMKESISAEAGQIVAYAGGFVVQSAKDEQALADIRSMLKHINAEIARIEESHQKRIRLASELARALEAMETDSKMFAEKHGKKP